MIELAVDLGDRSYPVLVGPGARHRLLEVLPQGVKKVAVVTQRNVGVTVDPGVEHKVLFIEEGETAKTLETVENLCRQFSQLGLTSKDCVVVVGGGLVTDLAGFAAAIYHRGIAYVNVATTLLAQIDAAVGGKTGANLPEGKNMIGAIWQPSAVLCDTEVIAQLPPREYLSGTGEMAKYHFLGSRVGIDTTSLEDLPLDERIARCVELKAKVVAMDERDGGIRAILNYGHTLGHAIEIAGSFDFRHGEAVSVGIHFAARLAEQLGRIDEARVQDHLKILNVYGLPTALPDSFDHDQLIELMYHDKKAGSGGLNFVLDGPDGVELVKDVDLQIIRQTLRLI